MGLLLHSMWVGYSTDFIYSTLICKLFMPLMMILGNTGTLYTCLIALERVLLSWYPLKFMKHGSSHRPTITAFCCFLICALLHTGSIVMLDSYSLDLGFTVIYFCKWSDMYYKLSGKSLIILSAVIFDYTLPVFLLILNSVLIVSLFRIKSERRKLFESMPANVRVTEYGRNALLLIIGIKTILANLPTTLTRLIDVPLPIKVLADVLYIFDSCF